MPQLRNNSNNTPRLGTSWWERAVVKRSVGPIDQIVDTMMASSSYLSQQQNSSQSSSSSLVFLDRQEILIGKMLGKGTYSSAFEIIGFDLQEEQEPFIEKEDHCQCCRETLQKSALRPDGTANYAIKHLKPELVKNPALLAAAAADLIIEAQFLKQLNHPNILQIHGMAYGEGSSAFAASGLYDDFFIIVDRLDHTLKDRLKLWKGQLQQQQKEDSCTSSSIFQCIQEKLNIALQTGRALAHLHEQRLVYRDLKPDNIGIILDPNTGEPTVQLIDFGFLRQLPEPVYTVDSSGTRKPENAIVFEDEMLFHMSGKGTLVYMGKFAEIWTYHR